MTGNWFVRVHGNDYGPVDFAGLQEWIADGRLIPENEVREAEGGEWTRAGEFLELFPGDIVPPSVPSPSVPQRSFGQLLGETWRIYCRGFLSFLGLTALVAVPRLCAELSAISAQPNTTMEWSPRLLLAALFNLAMFALSLAAWPVYLAGIQLLTVEVAEHRSIGWRDLIGRAVRSWPRVAILCLLVYGALTLLTSFGFAILLLVATAGNSLVVAFVSLGLLVLQVWMFGRVYANVLFWQQAAVLEDAGVGDALRRSKELARPPAGIPWYRRPIWRGTVVASLWCLFVAALTVGPQWSNLVRDFQMLSTMNDPQKIVEMLSAHSRAAGGDWLGLAADTVQAILRPLLGIAFVLLYFEAKARGSDERR